MDWFNLPPWEPLSVGLACIFSAGAFACIVMIFREEIYYWKSLRRKKAEAANILGKRSEDK